ncbi:MAG: hypothetical protein RI601_07150 [Desulfurivibrionaceae bacterium]|nr:hypothetical protein [Desulfurivibrionaceae bacterium]
MASPLLRTAINEQGLALVEKRVASREAGVIKKRVGAGIGHGIDAAPPASQSPGWQLFA